MSLTDWADGIVSTSGNMNDASGGSDKYYFTYTTQMGSNYSMYFEYGLGIQYPLRYVGNGALLNLVVPSKWASPAKSPMSFPIYIPLSIT